jgi:hypothetical protein
LTIHGHPADLHSGCPGVGAFLLLHRYVVASLRFLLNPHVHFLFSRYIAQPYLLRRRRFYAPVSRLRAGLHVLHFGGTLVCNILGVATLDDARSRAGSLALLHFIPSLFSPHLGLPASFMGLPILAFHHLHSAVGFMTVLQSLIHIIIALQGTPFSFANRFLLYGLVVCVSVVT